MPKCRGIEFVAAAIGAEAADEAAASKRQIAHRVEHPVAVLDLDVVLIGTGTVPLPLPDHAAATLREAGVRFDTMTTGAAVRTRPKPLS